MRWGKASRGSPPKRRTVLTVPEMDWIVPVLEQWFDEVRGRFNPGRHPALWVTERRGRLAWSLGGGVTSLRPLAGRCRIGWGLPWYPVDASLCDRVVASGDT